MSELKNIQKIIDEIFSIVDMDYKHYEINSVSFSIILFDLVSKIMNLVELTLGEEKGQIKKYIVVNIGYKFIEKYFPEYEDYFNDYIDTLIEIIIQSFYMLKKSKKRKSCFSYFQKKIIH